MNDMNKYDDIINLEHHVSKVHKQMSLENRSAQFAPFAALTGYEDEVQETARITEDRIELDEEQKILINEKLNIIESQIATYPEVSVTYFVPDTKKEGGSYQTIKEKVKRINNYSNEIIFCSRIKNTYNRNYRYY